MFDMKFLARNLALIGAVCLLLAEVMGETRTIFAGVPTLDNNQSKNYLQLSGEKKIIYFFFELIFWLFGLIESIKSLLKARIEYFATFIVSKILKILLEIRIVKKWFFSKIEKSKKVIFQVAFCWFWCSWHCSILQWASRIWWLIWLACQWWCWLQLATRQNWSRWLWSVGCSCWILSWMISGAIAPLRSCGTSKNTTFSR